MWRLRFWVIPLVLTVAAGLATVSFSQNAESTDSIKRSVDEFFSVLGIDQNAQQAFERLLGRSPLARHPSIQEMVTKVEGFDDKYGTYVKHAVVLERTLGAERNAVFLKYLYLSENYPGVWHFTFYRRPSRTGENRDWVLIGVRFDTDLETLAVVPRQTAS